MRNCREEDVKWLEESVRKYYPNSICFSAMDKISFSSNWFSAEFENLFVSLDACQNTDDLPDKCKPLPEIHQFIQQNAFYTITQKTVVDRNIYLENSDPYYSEGLPDG